jgi:hypothetical protein
MITPFLLLAFIWAYSRDRNRSALFVSAAVNVDGDLPQQSDIGDISSDSGGDRGEPTTRLEVDGDAVKLDHLGPIIVNEDGTMRRIVNWDLLTEREKQATFKRIAARNKKRVDALKEKMPEQAARLEEEVGVELSGDTLLLPYTTSSDAQSNEEGPASPQTGGDGSDESSWPPPENAEYTSPPKSMF